MEEVKISWGWLMALGISLLMLGMMAVAVPFIPGIGLVLVIGIILIAGGLAHLFHLPQCIGGKGFGIELLSGVVYLVLGGIIVTKPGAGLLGLTIIISALIFIEGIVQIIVALGLRPLERWGWTLASGIISVILALIIWSGWPISAAWLIGTLIGVALIFKGWAAINIAVMLKNA